MKLLILQQIAFQGVWLLCALGGARGQSWPGVLAAALFLTVSLGFVRRKPSDWALVGLAMGIGGGLDAVWASGGWISYPGNPARIGASPLWILALWAAFGPTLAATFAWLRSRPGLAAGLGAAGGVVAFAAGARLGAAEIARDPVGWLVIGLGFGLAVPLMLAASAGLERLSGRLRVAGSR